MGEYLTVCMALVILTISFQGAVAGRHHSHKIGIERPKFRERHSEFDIEESSDDASRVNHGSLNNLDNALPEEYKRGDKRGKIDDVGDFSNNKPNRKKTAEKKRQEEQERGWHYCADGRPPKNVADLSEEEQGIGHMCRDLYPTSTCCYDHDLTMELVGDKILEQIPNLQCAKMLMKMRCAHCSPRSWWLFHAPDMIRYPHKRVLPIMCPKFCRKFHRICRDSVAGLQADNFCDFHTTNEEGPCFPDSFIRRGTID